MKFTILKSEDILFKNSQGEQILAQKVLDTDEVSSIEGVSEHSVLQLEHKGETYLLTEEFVVDATLEDLDEFLEEYDEEDEENSDHTLLYDPQIIEEDEELVETSSDDEFDSYSYQSSELEKDVEVEEESDEIELSTEEAIKEEFKELDFLRQHSDELGKSEAEVVNIDGSSDASLSLEKVTENYWTEEDIVLEEYSSTSEEKEESTIELEKVEPTSSSSTPLSLHYINALVETQESSKESISSNNEVTTLSQEIKEESLEEETEVENEPESTLVLESEPEVEPEPVPEPEPTPEPEPEPVPEPEPTPEPAPEPEPVPEDSALVRLENESLQLGDLEELGIIGFTDSEENIARVNNVLADTDVSIEESVASLQAIVDVLIKVAAKDGDSSAANITREEFQLLGLNNVSTPDANELNIALANANSLDLGTTPNTNLQTIEDSLNALDQVKYGNTTGVELSDLTNIGVIGVGGEDEPTLEMVNAVLYDSDVRADHTNSVQAIVDTLTKLKSANGDAEVEMTASELETLGIVATDGEYSTNDLDYINSKISESQPADADGDGIYWNDMVELQTLVDYTNGKNIGIGTSGDDTFTYGVNNLFDGEDGEDSVVVETGAMVDLSGIENIETILLHDNTTVGSVESKLTMQDVIDMTDGDNLLVIESQNGLGTESVYLDTDAFLIQASVDDYPYSIYTSLNSNVTIHIEDTIIVE
ncbi:MAG: hypothetical protein K0U38_07775 [Epsilonproteobacteria bacterium]|nr:hypothetical protein [Campylobacterota bacterium]